MKVHPLENYQLLGTSIKLDKTRTYDAVPATNQPNWEERGAVFVEGVLLNAGEYEII